MATTKIITEVTDLNAASSTNGLKMPTGGAYSGTPTDGMVRNSSETGSQGSANVMQHFNGTEWKNYENLPSPFSANYLVVAGGGSGGSQYGGGGGAGGLKTTTAYGGSGAPLSLLKSTPYIVTVGAGGAGVIYSTSPSNNGENSIFDSVTATGGGYGGYFFGGSTASTGGNSGGSGGGGAMGLTAGVSPPGGIATPAGEGFNGGNGYRGSGTDYNGGGGGGAGAAGQNGTDSGYAQGGIGGAGLEVNIIGGTGNYYAGGGGGSGNTSGGAGGIGGGGSAGGAAVDTKSGIINTGGGGGGMLPIIGPYSGSGGSGIVILRYPTASVSSYAVTGTLDTVADTAYPIANLAYYKLNGDALDSSGNGYNGAASNLSPYAAGRFGQAAVFNGSSSKVALSGSTSLTNRTISMWFNPSKSTNLTLLDNTQGKVNGSKQFGRWNMLFNYGGTNYAVWNEYNGSQYGMATFSYTFQVGTWYHIAFCVQSGNNAVYVNGVSQTLTVTRGTSIGTVNLADCALGFDRDFTSLRFDGKIDQVRIFNSAISAANVTSLYNEGTVVESTDGTDSILQFIGGTGTVTFS
jgi:hypothetical protein